ncbi:hypothetical protein QBC31_22265 [Streptomyces sp. B21-079]|uniref:hypothetical protein n=1 Tax=Streptomyces sp. B21-079 TaxID=3039409 RepID=UPI002FF2148D
MIAQMYIHFELRSGLRLYGPGCVVLPRVPRSFGLRGDGAPADGLSFVRGFGFLRLLLALVAALALAWGALYGHAVECIAAVLAAVLVDAIGGSLRGRREV